MPLTRPILSLITIVSVLSSCVTYHRYSPKPSEITLQQGKILIFAGPAAFESETSKFEIDIDSSGTLWYVGITYYPKRGMSGCEFDLIADSMIINIDSIHYTENIPDSTKYEVHCDNFTVDLTLLGIRLPKDKFISDFELIFNLTILTSETKALIERRLIHVQMLYHKDREFYWGK